MTPPGVLVVDDEEDVRSSAADILRGEGYDVVEACDGEEALQLLRRRSVSVMVLDVRMPRRDGIAVLDALAQPPPAVVVSAYCLDPSTKRRLGKKIAAFLKKPFPPMRLLEEVAAASSTTVGGRPESAGNGSRPPRDSGGHK
ncbi:MAG TPA: response regulator [Acidimicrobiales bacterium]|nr:response regulator [Acidimicrobiales bacterium]